MSRFVVPRHYAAMQPLITLGENIHAAGRLEAALTQLVMMRVSQINGCAFCLDILRPELSHQGRRGRRR